MKKITSTKHKVIDGHTSIMVPLKEAFDFAVQPEVSTSSTNVHLHLNTEMSTSIIDGKPCDGACNIM